MKKQIIFSIDDPDYICPEKSINIPPRIEILKLSKEGFFYKGERVDDIHNCYERFNEWLTLAMK